MNKFCVVSKVPEAPELSHPKKSRQSKVSYIPRLALLIPDILKSMITPYGKVKQSWRYTGLTASAK